MQAYSPSQRARAIYYFFGWQGGTIHQLAAVTGLSVNTILHANLLHDGNDGFSAIRTCDREWRRDRLAPKHIGDWAFYSAAIVGFWATGALDGLNNRYPKHHTPKVSA